MFMQYIWILTQICLLNPLYRLSRDLYVNLECLIVCTVIMLDLLLRAPMPLFVGSEDGGEFLLKDPINQRRIPLYSLWVGSLWGRNKRGEILIKENYRSIY